MKIIYSLCKTPDGHLNRMNWIQTCASKSCIQRYVDEAPTIAKEVVDFHVSFVHDEK